MAVLALAAAGAALAPAGYAAVGWTVGAVVGQLLFPGSLPDQTGPRVGDLKAQQSQYGVAIPILYGTTRVAGNVIWSTDLIETVNSTEVGGKGGPSQTQTSYSYRVSMAVLLGEGELLGVRKIWADGKLIYNLAADADIGTVAASNLLAPGLTFYPGSTTQEPDPTMEAYLGVGQVPAYRGRAYLVFTDLQLAAYGNRRPNITAEVVASGSLSNTVTFGVAPPTATYRGIATDGSIFLALGRSGPGGVTRSVDGITWGPFLEFLPAVTNMECIAYGGGTWVVGTTAASVYTSTDAVNWTSRTIPTTGLEFVAHNGAMWVGGRAGTSQMAYSYDGEAWFLGAFPASATWRDVAWNGSLWTAIAAGGELATSVDGVSWTSGAVGFGSAWSQIESNGTRFVAVQNGVAGAGYSTNGTSWTSTTLASSQWLGLAWTGDYWLAVGSNNDSARSTDNGSTWTVTVLSGPVGNSLRGIAVAGGLAVGGPVSASPFGSAIFRYDIITPSAVTLSSVVTDLCRRAGLSGADINVTALSGTVHGYAIGQQMSVRSALEPLQRAFYFDAVESDSVIAFRPRGGAAVATIPEDRLGGYAAGDNAPDDLTITRQQEVELPASVSVVYIDVDADYQQSTQQAQRSTTLSTQTTGVELAIAMTADRARAIAETLMYDAWTQRQRYTFRTTREYAALEPSDVVTVTRGGTTHTLRIQRKVESRSGVIEFDAVAEESSVYTQSIPGGSSLMPTTSVRSAPATILAPLDLPLLRDQDDDSGFYIAARGVTDGWQGAVIYRSTDSGASYDEAGSITTESVIGYAINALANFTGHPNTFDQQTLFNVSLYGGTLSSATEDAVLNGANYLAVGFEIIQFKSAVLVSAGSYQLSGLLRGRRGTEWAISGHTAGERIVLLTEAGLRRITSDLTASRLYKPVSIGRTVQDTNSQAITNFGGSYAPFAPVNLGGGRNAAGDVTINWMRRSRVGINLPAFYDPPLGEASESYDVEIWNSSFTVLRRTFASLTTTTASYTAAQQTTDAGGLQAIVYVRIYQRSAVTGRGYVLQGTV
jgi:hypothetical protein